MKKKRRKLLARESWLLVMAVKVVGGLIIRWGVPIYSCENNQSGKFRAKRAIRLPSYFRGEAGGILCTTSRASRLYAELAVGVVVNRLFKSSNAERAVLDDCSSFTILAFVTVPRKSAY